MSATMEHEQRNIFRLDLQDRLRKVDFDYCGERLKSEIARCGTVRLLIVLRDFSGWDPTAPWADLSFYAQHGDAIERIAIVGPNRWRNHMLMFAGADLRQAPVEYFLPGTIAEARAWLSS
ncbi:MAG TPA: STAS/SEC14 domain-containing protein [Gemmatimonadaceae bacterium]